MTRRKQPTAVTTDPVEVEVIGLQMAVMALDDFVNRLLLHLPESGSGQPAFAGLVARDLFAVRLLDFLEPVSVEMTGVVGSCVDLIHSAVTMSSFNRDGSVEALRAAIGELQAWLDERITVRLWLPAIDREVDVTITRHNVLYVAGNTSKHNLSRLSNVAKRLRTVLAENGQTVGLEESWLIIENIQERFNEDLLAFYCTRITGLLNDVRWGIHEYLLPEYRRSFTRDPSHEVMYGYQYPAGVVLRFAQVCYWDLMNKVRSGPILPKFKVPEYLKEHPFLVPDNDDREADSE
jgi:hypothetical protein